MYSATILYTIFPVDYYKEDFARLKYLRLATNRNASTPRLLSTAVFTMLDLVVSIFHYDYDDLRTISR